MTQPTPSGENTSSTSPNNDATPASFTAWNLALAQMGLPPQFFHVDEQRFNRLLITVNDPDCYFDRLEVVQQRSPQPPITLLLWKTGYPRAQTETDFSCQTFHEASDVIARLCGRTLFAFHD